MDLTGQVIDRYELKQLFGVGAMGEVYAAYQTDLEREVAMKVMSKAVLGDEEAVNRFLREVKLAASLEHRNIVPIYDYGTYDDMPYVTMRLLKGGSLRDRVLQLEDKRMSLQDVANLLRDLADALDYAHSRGVVHRDVKPTNIMFDQNGHTYLVDFGIAKLVHEKNSITQSGAIVGTPTHMAPEQWRSEQVTAAADQYALAVIVYELMAGMTPFVAPNPYGLMVKHLYDDPTPIYTLNADVPRMVWFVVAQALAKSPDKRFRSVQEFADNFTDSVKRSTTNLRVTGKPETSESLTDENTATITAEVIQVTDSEIRRADQVTDSEIRRADRVDLDSSIANRSWVTGQYHETKVLDDSVLVKAHTSQITPKTRRPALVTGAIALVAAAIIGAGVWFAVFSPIGQPRLTPRQDVPILVAPGRGGDVLMEASDKQTFDITGISEDRDWYRVRMADGAEGWVVASTAFVGVRGSLGNVPVIGGAAPPAPTTTVQNTTPDATSLPARTAVPATPIPTPAQIDRMMNRSGWITDVEFNEAGSNMVTASTDGVVRLWDPAIGGLVADMDSETDSILDAAFSPNGFTLAAADGAGIIHLWLLQDFVKLPSTLQGHEGPVWSVGYDPTGNRLVSGGSDGTVRLWDLVMGTEQAALRGHEGPVLSVVFSPDGTQIASAGSDGTIRLWDAENGIELAVLRGHKNTVWSVAYSPDGTRLASASLDATVRYWDTTTHDELNVLRGHTRAVYDISYSPDGTLLASGGADTTIQIWDATSGMKLTNVLGHDGPVLSVRFSPDSTKIGSGGEDGTWRYWTVRDSQPEPTPTIEPDA